MDDIEKDHAAALIAGGLGKDPDVDADADAEADAPGEVPKDLLLASKAVRQAMSKGDDEEFASALKSFVSLCTQY